MTNNLTFQLTTTVGDIVAQVPKASELFKKHKIDFCCGGHLSLMEAMKAAGANDVEVMNRLTELYEDRNQMGQLEDKDWYEEQYSLLIDHIVSTHHAYMRKVMPELSELSTKILEVHGPGHDYLTKVYKLVHTLKMDIDQHLLKEEQILFPLIKQYEASPSRELLEKLLMIKTQMENEHADAGDILKQLREVTEDYTLPVGACKTFTRTYMLLEEMETDLFQHIHLENNILFKRLEDEAK